MSLKRTEWHDSHRGLPSDFLRLVRGFPLPQRRPYQRSREGLSHRKSIAWCFGQRASKWCADQYASNRSIETRIWEVLSGESQDLFGNEDCYYARFLGYKEADTWAFTTDLDR